MENSTDYNKFLENKAAFERQYSTLLDELSQLGRCLGHVKGAKDENLEKINKMAEHVNDILHKSYLQISVYTAILKQAENFKKLTDCITELVSC